MTQGTSQNSLPSNFRCSTYNIELKSIGYKLFTINCHESYRKGCLWSNIGDKNLLKYDRHVNHLNLNPFPNVLVFTGLQYNSFENTAGKGEIARNEQFLLFPQCF